MENKTFETLNSINVQQFIEVKDNGFTKLSYLSWSSAYEVLMKNYPDADYEIVHWDGKPYLYDEKLGYMVETRMTINGQTKEMWLPVMDNNNKAMKDHPYAYKTKKGEKTVEAATMFDINTTIMRCLVKNISVFGLGLYIYKGEDLPTSEAEEIKKAEEEKKKEAEEYKKSVERLKKLCTDKKLVLAEVMKEHKIARDSNSEYINKVCDKLDGKQEQ